MALCEVIGVSPLAGSSLWVKKCETGGSCGVRALPPISSNGRRHCCKSCKSHWKNRLAGWHALVQRGQIRTERQTFGSTYAEMLDDRRIATHASRMPSSSRIRLSSENLKQTTTCAAASSTVFSKELSERRGMMTDEEREEAERNSKINWFRKAWPYIQGHRSSIFVIVLPGEVIADVSKINGVIQDILLLHGNGIKLVIIPGSQVQIDQLLTDRGHKPMYEGAYRITDAEALAASMEAAGRIRVAVEAKLSQGPCMPALRRHRDNSPWNEVSVASGNYLAAKRRGVVDGVDFCATGEVKRIDTARIRERLDNHSIVLLGNLGYSSIGEVLNCNTFEVATACAISLRADKLLVMLDGPVLDENGRPLRFMTLKEADRLIRQRASESYAAADYVKAVAGSEYVKSLGIKTRKPGAHSMNGEARRLNGESRAANGIDRSVNEGSRTTPGDQTTNPGNQALDCHSENSNLIQWQCNQDQNLAASSSPAQESSSGGFAIGGQERNSRAYGYLSELAAAVYACRNGVGRVQLLDSSIQGALLLELYTHDGIGVMVSSDSYEGVREALSNDIPSIRKLLQPLEESGILVNRPQKQIVKEINYYMVLERDGNVVACGALFPHFDDHCGEVAAFAVSHECQGNGVGGMLLGYVENKAKAYNLDKLFLLTTRTADWFVQRGFLECGVENIPKKKRETINFARGSKYYTKNLE